MGVIAHHLVALGGSLGINFDEELLRLGRRDK